LKVWDNDCVWKMFEGKKPDLGMNWRKGTVRNLCCFWEIAAAHHINDKLGFHFLTQDFISLDWAWTGLTFVLGLIVHGIYVWVGWKQISLGPSFPPVTDHH